MNSNSKRKLNQSKWATIDAQGVAKSIARKAIRRFDCHTKPVVVFESDDWGSIRVPSREALEVYCAIHPEFHPHHYQAFDGLETRDDYDALENVLLSHADSRGRSAMFTLNFAMANPVFDDELLIQRRFCFESIGETYSHYFEGKTSFLDKLLEELGKETCVFKPQLHGREHLNATMWMNATLNDNALLDAYELKMIGVNSGIYSDMDALNANNTLIDRDLYIRDAARMFKEVFGFSSSSFIAPCYVIDSHCEAILADEGVTILQGARKMNRSRKNGSLIKVPKLMGSKNCFRQIQLIRNCTFEPSKSLFAGKTVDDCVEDTLKEVSMAFDAGLPAVICTHRVNYTSLISENNRDSSLEALDKLLHGIEAEYSIVQYKTSDELGDLIRGQ